MVITGLTRNQLNRKVPWVRIPPAPPEITPVVGFPGCWLFFSIRCKAQAIEHCIWNPDVRKCSPQPRSRCDQAIPESASWEHRLPEEARRSYAGDRDT